jgi:hypothetical protein
MAKIYTVIEEKHKISVMHIKDAKEDTYRLQIGKYINM